MTPESSASSHSPRDDGRRATIGPLHHQYGGASEPTVRVRFPSSSSPPGGSNSNSNSNGRSSSISTLFAEIKYSADLVFSSRLTWLLIAGPLALAGSVTGTLPESTCFALAGLALVPCAERLSFVTEQVAAHTNGTIGALLNATFGNAPELLISTAALRAGYYRVIQLAMLGSILCNLLFVFGLSCLVGGLRWQVQDLRIVSGSVPIAVLLLSTAGIALPAALKMSGQIADLDGDGDIAAELIGFSRFDALVMMGAYAGYLTFQLGTHKDEYDDSEVQHDRYVHHHQGGGHPQQHNLLYSPPLTPSGGGGGGGFGGGGGGWRKRRARRNLFCRSAYQRGRSGIFQAVNMEDPDLVVGGNNSDSRATTSDVEMAQRRRAGGGGGGSSSLGNGEGGGRELPFRNEYVPDDDHNLRAAAAAAAQSATPTPPPQSRRHDGSNVSFRSNSRVRDDDDDGDDDDGGGGGGVSSALELGNGNTSLLSGSTTLPRRSQSGKLRSSDTTPSLDQTGASDASDDADADYGSDHHLMNGSSTGGGLKEGGGLYEEGFDDEYDDDDEGDDDEEGPPMSFRTGIIWLFVITIAISSMSDILVETIDGFALKMHISEVFTSVIVVPFFSNIAEQVSAVIFAYRNEMDLCVGITVGSAAQIALMVMPGCVLVGWAVDRSMSMYLRGYETCCLLIGVLLVSAVLAGGTTNWLSGLFFMVVYFIMAAGFWFHELEVLDVDAEAVLHNATVPAA